MNWLALVKLIVPIVTTATIPGAGPIIGGLIVKGIESAEQIKGASGSEKLDHAIEMVQTGIDGVNAVKPGLIPDVAAQDISVAISKSVDAVNQIHK